MHNKIKKAYSPFADKIQYYDALLKAFSDKQLNWKPDDDSWSMMEVMHHLYISMQLSIDFVKRFDFDRKSERLGIMSQAKTILLVNRLNSKKRYKAPKVLREADGQFMLPNKPAEFQRVWRSLQEDIKSTLEDFPADKLNYFSFYQPVVGKMKVTQMLHFFKAHLRHHEHQIERINHHNDFPL